VGEERRALFGVAGRIRESEPENPQLAAAIGNDFKGKISIVIYAAAIALVFVHTLLSCALYAVVAITWLIPDRRIEKSLHH